MTTAVDTKVLVDVFRNDPLYCDCAASSDALRRCMREGRLTVCDVVWAELAALFESEQVLRENLAILGVDYLPMDCDAATMAGQMWKRYRARRLSKPRRRRFSRGRPRQGPVLSLIHI